MYVDTSVLVKLFVHEPGSEYFGALVDGQAICSSVLAYTEMRSALLGKERVCGLAKSWSRKAWSAFDGHARQGSLELVALNPAIFQRANRIMEACHPKFPLRTLDALHLATADQVQDWPLVTHDQWMLRAAKFLEFPISTAPP